MSEHKAIARTILEVTINDEQVAKILKKELEDYFGIGENIFIKDGYLGSEDQPSKANGIIRKTSKKEIELYDAFKKVESYFLQY